MPTAIEIFLHWTIAAPLLQCFSMADWRQIQARIRKAKNGPDALTKLSDLYARTHDAMVAWELALIGEKAAQNDEAVKWYTISAERFRRPEWKKKAEEALSRLGAASPVAQLKPNIEENTESFHVPAQTAQEIPLALGEIPDTEEEAAEETAATSANPGQPVESISNGDAARSAGGVDAAGADVGAKGLRFPLRYLHKRSRNRLNRRLPKCR